MIIGVVDWQI